MNHGTTTRRVLRLLAPALLLLNPLGTAREPSAAGELRGDRWSLFPGRYVVEHVDVLPMTGEGRLEARDVHILDGIITSIDKAGAMPLVEGEIAIDGRGWTLLPGLVDMHVHAKSSEPDEQLVLYLAHGVTSVQSMHGSPEILRLREQLESGAVLGPRFFTTGPTTATKRIDTPAKARRMARDQRAAGYDAIKMYGDGNNSMTEETFRALIDAAHEQGLRVVGHAPRNLPFAAVLASGQDSIDHMEEIVYTSRPILDVIGPLIRYQFGDGDWAAAESILAEDTSARLDAAIRRVATQVRAADLSLTPTLIAFTTIHQHTNAAFDELLKHPQGRFMSPLTRRSWLPDNNRYRQAWAERLDIMSRVLGMELDVQKRLVRAFHAAGVPILAGTDAPLTYVFPGWSLHRELALFVECGFTPYEALRAATVLPAVELGMEASCGTVAVGKQADLLLVRGDPLEDLGNLARVAGVFSRGRWLGETALQAGLDRLMAKHELQAEQLGVLDPLIASKDPRKTVAALQEMKAVDPSLVRHVEAELNSLGYERLNAGEEEAALDVFLAIVDAFPQSANAWDSLGEFFMQTGDSSDAIRCYTRSLEMNPSNDNARRMLERLSRK